MADSEAGPVTNQAQQGYGHQYGPSLLSDNARIHQGDVHNVSTTYHSAEHSTVQARKDLAEALQFDGMHARAEQLALSGIPVESFEWIWETEFVEWLSKSAPFFWITGKPGSGKSTLMKHLSDSFKTLEHLKMNTVPYTVVAFFFDYRAGSSAANDLEGLLRLILSRLSKQFEDIESYLARSNIIHSLKDLTQQQLMDTLCELAPRLPSRLCAFVDGLDEYQGDQHILISHLQRLQSRMGMKLVLASRAESLFQSAFQRYPHLRMQDHNSASVLVYIDYTVRKARQSLSTSVSIFDQALREQVMVRAEGVIIWARLAVDELLISARRGGTTAELYQILDQLPQELEQMYDRIFSRMTPEHSSEACLILAFLDEWGGRAFAGVMHRLCSYVGSNHLPILFSQPIQSEDDFADRLVSLISPLVDQVRDEDSPIELRLMHKTVSFYLRTQADFTNRIHTTFRSKYSDHFVVRIYQEVLDEVESDCSSNWKAIRHSNKPVQELHKAIDAAKKELPLNNRLLSDAVLKNPLRRTLEADGHILQHLENFSASAYCRLYFFIIRSEMSEPSMAPTVDMEVLLRLYLECYDENCDNLLVATHFLAPSAALDFLRASGFDKFWLHVYCVRAVALGFTRRNPLFDYVTGRIDVISCDVLCLLARNLCFYEDSNPLTSTSFTCTCSASARTCLDLVYQLGSTGFVEILVHSLPWVDKIAPQLLRGECNICGDFIQAMLKYWCKPSKSAICKKHYELLKAQNNRKGSKSWLNLLLVIDKLNNRRIRQSNGQTPMELPEYPLCPAKSRGIGTKVRSFFSASKSSSIMGKVVSDEEALSRESKKLLRFYQNFGRLPEDYQIPEQLVWHDRKRLDVNDAGDIVLSARKP